MPTLPINPGRINPIASSSDLSKITQMSSTLVIPEIVADALWIFSININCPSSGSNTRAFIEYAPANSDTGQIIMSQTKRIMVQDIYNDVDTTLSDFMGNLYSYVQNYVNTNNSYGIQITENTKPIIDNTKIVAP